MIHENHRSCSTGFATGHARTRPVAPIFSFASHYRQQAQSKTDRTMSARARSKIQYVDTLSSMHKEQFWNGPHTFSAHRIPRSLRRPVAVLAQLPHTQVYT